LAAKNDHLVAKRTSGGPEFVFGQGRAGLFTPGIIKGMAPEDALALDRDRLARGSFTLEGWVLAEKDLVDELDTDGF